MLVRFELNGSYLACRWGLRPATAPGKINRSCATKQPFFEAVFRRAGGCRLRFGRCVVRSGMGRVAVLAAEFERGHGVEGPERLDQIARIGEPQPGGNLLDGERALRQQLFDGADAVAADVAAQLLVEVVLEVGPDVGGSQVKRFAEGLAGEPFGAVDLLLDVLQHVEGPVGMGIGLREGLIDLLQIVVGDEQQDAVEPRPNQRIGAFARSGAFGLDEPEEQVGRAGILRAERYDTLPDRCSEGLFDASAEVVGGVLRREADEDILAAGGDGEAVGRVGRDQEERPRPVAALSDRTPLLAYAERSRTFAHVDHFVERMLVFVDREFRVAAGQHLDGLVEILLPHIGKIPSFRAKVQ